MSHYNTDQCGEFIPHTHQWVNMYAEIDILSYLLYVNEGTTPNWQFHDEL